MFQSEPKTLGAFLKSIMEARGLTERIVAQGAGIAQSGLSHIIQEKAHQPDPRTLRAIANYLGIDVFILFRLLGYVPPDSEPYGSYSPLSLYIAHRFDHLPAERQEVLLHTLEALLKDVEIKAEVRSVRENLNSTGFLTGLDEAFPEKVTQFANWYLTNGRFATPADIDPTDKEEVSPGVRFGDLDTTLRTRLIALLRHKMRQIYAPFMVERTMR